MGQLLFVAVVLLAWSALQALPIRWPEKSIYIPTYAIGALAVFWVFERTRGFLQGF